MEIPKLATPTGFGISASLKSRNTENDYHIGSGLVESACKMIVTQRLKQSGMRWTEPGAESMAHLRSFLLSDRSADISRFARAA